MAMNATQKGALIERTMQIARAYAAVQKSVLALNEEFVAEGGAATLIATGDLTAYGPAAGLTGTEFSDGFTAITNISATITTNKTNLYKIAAASTAI